MAAWLQAVRQGILLDAGWSNATRVPRSRVQGDTEAAPRSSYSAGEWRMNRKRAWEIGAGVVLLLAVAVVAGAYLRQRSLNMSLAEALQDVEAAKVQRLLDQGADAHTRGADGASVLTFAARHRDPELLEAGLARGLDVNESDDYGLTPIIWAALFGDVPLSRRLLAAGADPNHAARNGLTALQSAALVGNTTMSAPPGTAGLSVKKPHPYPKLIRLLKQHGATK